MDFFLNRQKIIYIRNHYIHSLYTNNQSLNALIDDVILTYKTGAIRAATHADCLAKKKHIKYSHCRAKCELAHTRHHVPA